MLGPRRRHRYRGDRRDQSRASTSSAARNGFERHDNFGLVALVGVQSNQYPRALDIARPFREPPEFPSPSAASMSRAACRCSTARRSISTPAGSMGISMFAGEAEGRLDILLRDAAAGRLAAALQLHEGSAGDRRDAGAVPPQVANIGRTLGLSASFDAGRGCPYQCSFCTIINVQGRKSRYRSADDVEELVRAQLGAGHLQILHHRRQFCAQQGVGGRSSIA